VKESEELTQGKGEGKKKKKPSEVGKNKACCGALREGGLRKEKGGGTVESGGEITGARTDREKGLWGSKNSTICPEAERNNRKGRSWKTSKGVLQKKKLRATRKRAGQ